MIQIIIRIKIIMRNLDSTNSKGKIALQKQYEPHT